MTVLATIVVLGVLIFVHELGHFWAAKLVGVEVQRFSIGLGPRLWGFRWGETEYVLSLVPLGGYVKMGGMDDEVLERLEGAPGGPSRPDRGFDAKPIWARALVISAGVLMNFVFAFLLYTVVAGWWGVREPASTRLGAVFTSSLPPGAEALAQIPRGARIRSVQGREVSTWGDVTRAFLEAAPGPVAVEYDDPHGSVELLLPSEREDRVRLVTSLAPWFEAVVGSVAPGSPAERGGLEAGDRILEVDGLPVVNWFDFLQAVEGRPGARVEVTLERGGHRLVRVVTLDRVEATDPATGEKILKGRMGVYRASDPVAYARVGWGEAIRVGYRETAAVTTLILGFLRDLVTGEVSPRSVGSLVTIGEASGQAASQGLDYLLSFMALFSVNLAILNLLPIPVLDGGHLLFLLIEAVRGGRALSAEQRARWSQVGFVVLLGIMVWALSNDFLRLLGL